jgi:hypothetical protein
MAEQDGKAFLDKITAETGQAKVTWVGHSQGSTQMFYGLADDKLRTYYQDKINLFVALAPVTNLVHMQSEFIKAWSKV